jgi:hypothetical protein
MSINVSAETVRSRSGPAPALIGEPVSPQSVKVRIGSGRQIASPVGTDAGSADEAGSATPAVTKR